MSRKLTIVRYKTQGNRYELLCFKEPLEEVREKQRRSASEFVSDDDIFKVVARTNIFSNVSKQELATKSQIQTAFGASSNIGKLCPVLENYNNNSENHNNQKLFKDHNFLTIARVILSRGEIVEASHDREEKRRVDERCYQSLLDIIPEMLFNIFSGVNPERSDVIESLSTKAFKFVSTGGELKEHVFIECDNKKSERRGKGAIDTRYYEAFGVPLLVQAGYIASMVAESLNCIRDSTYIEVTYVAKRIDPSGTCLITADDSAWSEFILSYYSMVMLIKREEFGTHSSDNGSEIIIRRELMVDCIMLKTTIWKHMIDCHTKEHSTKMSDVYKKLFSNQDIDAPTPKRLFRGPINDDDYFGLWSDDKNINQCGFCWISNDNSMDKNVLNDTGNAVKNDCMIPNRNINKNSKTNESKKEADTLYDTYSSMTHKKLQTLCRVNNLSTGGGKKDLIERLVSFFEQLS